MTIASGAVGAVVGAASVHVWRLEATPMQVDRREVALSAEELARGARLPHGARERFLSGRAALRRILGAYLGQAAGAVELRYEARGKPFVEGGVAFSVSHSASHAVLAVALEGPIGVDLEEIRPFAGMARMTRRCLSHDEALAVWSVDEPERSRRFFACWTRKEAYLKAVGTGLSAPLAALEVMNPRDAGPRLLPPAGFPGGLRVVDLELGPELAGALALPPHVLRVSFMDEAPP